MDPKYYYFFLIICSENKRIYFVPVDNTLRIMIRTRDFSFSLKFSNIFFYYSCCMHIYECDMLLIHKNFLGLNVIFCYFFKACDMSTLSSKLSSSTYNSQMFCTLLNMFYLGVSQLKLVSCYGVFFWCKYHVSNNLMGDVDTV